MGCGESKLAVATSNTILRRKKSSVAGDSASKKSKDIGTVLENSNNAVPNSIAPEDEIKSGEQLKEDEIINNNDNNNVGGGDGETQVVVVVAEDDENVKEINVNKKDGDDKKKGDKEEQDDRLISHGSPNRFFSSRKLDEEGIDGIISEGRSGTSDYYTPRHGKGNLHFKVDHDDIAEDDKESDLPAQTKAPEADKKETTEEPVKPEGKAAKEAEKVKVVPASVEANVVDEAKVVDDEAKLVDEAKVAEPKASTPAKEEEKKA